VTINFYIIYHEKIKYRSNDLHGHRLESRRILVPGQKKRLPMTTRGNFIP